MQRKKGKRRRKDTFSGGRGSTPFAYEQKAVCILLTLLHLGIKNILLGPSLPAFVSPAVLKLLAEKYALAPISTPHEDLKKLLS